jgi:flagellar protein FliO/FliZ
MNYQPELISSALRMLVALGVILGGLLIILYYTKHKFKTDIGRSNGKLIRVLGSSYIGVKKHISLVQVPGAILILGITNDNVCLLSKVEDETLIQKIKEDEVDEHSLSFSEQLHKLAFRFKEHKNKRP